MIQHHRAIRQSHYQHLFFDLDHTLWDFERNSGEALRELFTQFELSNYQFELTPFLKTYEQINYALWDAYNKAEIDQTTLRRQRFRRVFAQLGKEISEDFSLELGEAYLAKTPYKPHLMPGAIETLSDLQQKGYKLHIITNGFADVQSIKLEYSGLAPFFDLVVTSENAGCKKPNPAIFEYAIEARKAEKSECVMIGDNLTTDIEGAINANIDAIFYNPQAVEHHKSSLISYEINSLLDLQKYL